MSGCYCVPGATTYVCGWCTYGRIAYEAFALAAGPDVGHRMPPWNELGQTDAGRNTQHCWKAAANAVSVETSENS